MVGLTDGKEEEGKGIIGWSDEALGDGETNGWTNEEERVGEIIGWMVGLTDGKEEEGGGIIGWSGEE